MSENYKKTGEMPMDEATQIFPVGAWVWSDSEKRAYGKIHAHSYGDSFLMKDTPLATYPHRVSMLVVRDISSPFVKMIEDQMLWPIANAQLLTTAETKKFGLRNLVNK